MPIRPEQRAKYPLDWKALSLHIRFVRARGRCEWCGNEHMKPRPDKQTTMVVLTTAHLDHNPENNAWTPQYDPRNNDTTTNNLAALCQACHLAHDADEHASNRRRHDSPETLNLFPDEPDDK